MKMRCRGKAFLRLNKAMRPRIIYFSANNLKDFLPAAVKQQACFYIKAVANGL